MNPPRNPIIPTVARRAPTPASHGQDDEGGRPTTCKTARAMVAPTISCATYRDHRPLAGCGELCGEDPLQDEVPEVSSNPQFVSSTRRASADRPQGHHQQPGRPTEDSWIEPPTKKDRSYYVGTRPVREWARQEHTLPPHLHIPRDMRTPEAVQLRNQRMHGACRCLGGGLQHRQGHQRVRMDYRLQA